MTLLFTRLEKVYNEECEREGYCVFYRESESESENESESNDNENESENSILLEISTEQSCCEIQETGIVLNGERLEHVDYISVSKQLELQPIDTISGLIDNTSDIDGDDYDDKCCQEMYFTVTFKSGDVLKVFVSNTHNGYYPHTGYYIVNGTPIRFEI